MSGDLAEKLLKLGTVKYLLILSNHDVEYEVKITFNFYILY